MSIARATSARTKRLRSCSPTSTASEWPTRARFASRPAGGARPGSATSSRSAFRPGFIEPLESTSIHLIQTAVNRLLELLPSGEISDVRPRELQSLAPLSRWSACATSSSFTTMRMAASAKPSGTSSASMEIPELAAAADRAFPLRRRAYSASLDELFDLRGWVQVMIGQGIVPQRWHPLADTLDESRAAHFLEMTRAGLCSGGRAPSRSRRLRVALRADAAPGRCSRSECVRTSLRLLAASIACVMGSSAAAQDYRTRLPEDEVIYFLLPDRFENGDASNDRGGTHGRPARDRVRPGAQGLLPRRRPQGPDQAARLYPGPRRDRGLAVADLQEQAGAGTPGSGERRLSRLLGDRLHAGRPASRHQRGLQGLRRRGARAGHEGLHGHHRQPHGGRDLSEGMRRAGAMPATAASPTIPTSGAADRAARRSTRASPASRPSRRISPG